jgi:hypothetical protein
MIRKARPSLSKHADKRAWQTTQYDKPQQQQLAFIIFLFCGLDTCQISANELEITSINEKVIPCFNINLAVLLSLPAH